MRLLDLDLLLGVGMQMLLLEDLKLHHFGWWHDADRHVPQAGRVVAKENSESTIDVVYNLPRHQQAELRSLDVEVEVSPAKDLFGLHGRL